MIGQDVTAQGLPTTTSSPTDLSISGNGFFVVSTNAGDTATQEYTRAGSFTPDSNGNLVNAAGLYLLGYKLDSSGNVPDQHQRSQPDQHHPACRARPQATTNVYAAGQSAGQLDGGSTYTAGDMAAGNVTPDFTAHHQCL